MTSGRRSRGCGLLGALVAWGLLAGRAGAAPEVTNLSPRGLQTGATTLLTIEGADLLPQPRVLLPIPVAAQVIQEGASAGRVQIAVTLPAAIAPGLYPLRVGSARGISNPVVIGIDGLVQVPFAVRVPALPAALHGNLADNATLQTSLLGKKGQRLVVDVEARRLGAAFDPVVELYRPGHVLLTYAQGRGTLSGDARLEAVLPADGRYTVELHDLLYRAGMPNYFRLKLGDLQYADLVFPLGGRRGTEAVFDLVGHVPPSAARIPVDLRGAAGNVAVPLPAQPGFVGPAPAILVADAPEVVAPAAGKPPEATPPVLLNGRISETGAEARWRLLVKPGMALRFDVTASRAGSPLDAVLALRSDTGATLAESDDRSNSVDPGLDYTVPAGVTALIVALRDLAGRGGPEYLYQIAVTPAGAPDFRLTVFEDRHQVPRPGAAVVRVRASRRNYDGPIQLTLTGLPAGVEVQNATIPAGASDTLLTLLAPPGIPLAQGLVGITGESTAPQVRLRRPALLPETAVTQRQPGLRRELGVAVTDPGPIQVAWDSSAPVLAIGSSNAVRVKVTRAAGVTGLVRLELLSSQVGSGPADGGQQNPSRTLRAEGVPTVAAGQTAGVLPVLVPADLPPLAYDLAVRAELLAADNQTVLAAAVTPARRLQASQPLVLRLTSSAAIQAPSGSGPLGKLTGKLLRAGGFTRPVTVTLEGLPPGLPAPSVVLPGNRSAFELPVAFPYQTRPGLLASARLVALSEIEPGRVLKSNAIPVAVQIVPGGPPPTPPPLYRVFEDEPGFAALLSEGDGQVALETVDRYAGTLALRIRGTQRLRAPMPGWGFKIAARPGPGEFRYLRFAWKKRGGTSILLQLNANGQWGPPRGGPGPSYRYEAGPGDNPLHAAAIKLDARLPDDWVVVTRDLFADFGPFALTGIALTPGPGDYGLFDHIYLARTLEDLKGCPGPVPPQQPLAVFEDQPQFVAELIEGTGTATLEAGDKYSGKVSARVTPDQRFNEQMPGLKIPIRQNPGPGEYRFLRFAWKKKGGQTICLQLNHDGQWGPAGGGPAKFRYHAGPGPEPYGASVQVAPQIPTDWVVVTRDLYADFGEFTWTGIALSPLDGAYGLFDHIYLGKTTHDFTRVEPKPAPRAR